MIMLFLIAIIAGVVLIFFNNKVKNRNIDRSNRLAEKHEELIRMLQEKNKKGDDVVESE